MEGQTVTDTTESCRKATAALAFSWKALQTLALQFTLPPHPRCLATGPRPPQDIRMATLTGAAIGRDNFRAAPQLSRPLSTAASISIRSYY